MRKLICFFVFITALAVLLAAMDQTFINKLKRDRYFDHLSPPSAYKRSLYYRYLVRSDRWRFGDLYGLCYLPGYKFRLEPFKKYVRDDPGPATNRALYIIGDSYLADKALDGAFDGFDEVKFLDRRFTFGPIVLDSSKQNYLIMEFAERNLNGFNFSRTAEVKWTPQKIASRSNFNSNEAAGHTGPDLPTTIPDRLNKAIFNKDLSRNLELLLFDDKLFTPVKELKASINYLLFGRVAKEVAVSSDKKRLLMNITVDTAYRESGFREVKAAEVSSISAQLAEANSYYLSIGFKTVFLSCIPNTASVCGEKRLPYNHLLERVEAANQFPVIKVFDKLRSQPDNFFYRSDAHWGPAGLDSWVAAVNNQLKRSVQ